MIGRNRHGGLRASVAALTAMALFSAGRLYGEYLFLKNGTVIEGKILKESPSSMSVLSPDGRTVTVQRDTVLRVMYTQLYRGKIYIQKTDGRVIEAYIIDEDQEYYTVRPELNSPKEFTIRRDDVLFMTRKNPSALEGKVSYRHVDLAWRKPYTPDNPVRQFKIYLRTKGGDYAIEGATAGTAYRVKGLRCNSEYYAMVTAVDKNGSESLPSNVIRFTTRKGRPASPDRVRLVSVVSGADGTCTASLDWDSAVDPCGGTVTGYGLYLKDLSSGTSGAGVMVNKQFPGYRLAGKAPGTSGKITGLRDKTRYRVIVTSIDNTGDESASGTSLSFTTENRMPDYPYPVSCEKATDGNGPDRAVKIRWEKAGDPDGTVTAYRVYRKSMNGPGLLGATDKTEFIAKNLPAGEQHYFTVRSVDNRGGESSDSHIASTGLVRYIDITAKGAFLIPVGRYGRLYKPGYGAAAMVSAENLFLDRMTLGVEAGYFHFSGKTDASRDASLVPFMAVMSYRFHLARWASLDPDIGFGGCYNRVSINTLGATPAVLYFMNHYAASNTVEFIFSAGAKAVFTLGKTALVQAGGSFHGIAEKGGLMTFFSVHAGVGARI
ncbi:MAG TPA: fibronectin type III domain-containing protein [Spirochaetota bacterium]|nr:fibronectin type III domain-containing protein [Spirochaetota bacterium]HPV42089.1 fibronectin type III domain-containing protein [Spirochaetota bacterium]